MRIAIISTYPPQKCGIATFTQDLYAALQLSKQDTVHIIAVSDTDEEHYPIEVSYIIEKHNPESYIEAAQLINRQYDICIVQHEYGIFGGKSGSYILALCQRLHIPLISNLHTILPKPSPQEKAVLSQLGHLSSMVTVMTNWAVDMVHQIYQLPYEKTMVIPHGVPIFDYDHEKAKEKLGFTSKKLMLSFGFLGPGKGFETAIEATKDIHDPDFVYVILGVTHPNVLASEGEKYRTSLHEKCAALHLENQIIFVNEFANSNLLRDYLTACDIYVTPYPNEGQISSGTLSFALGAGAAVVSTPYLYAKDLLADDRGLLFDFSNNVQLSQIINNLLETPELLQKFRTNARRHGEKMQWPNIGRIQRQLFQSVYTNNKQLYKRA